MENLRDFAKDLRPPALDDLGLVASISKLLLDFSEGNHIKSHLKLIGEEKRLPPQIEVGLFRILQEALRNVDRHSGATEVMVTIGFEIQQTKINIKDNGRGFDLAAVKERLTSTNHFGLVGMQERADLFGGKLEIESGQGKGTTVTISVPVG
jgi:two-component system sensor histidine kinase DegS